MEETIYLMVDVDNKISNWILKSYKFQFKNLWMTMMLVMPITLSSMHYLVNKFFVNNK